MSDRLELTRLRDLTLREPPQPGRAAHLSAASGLVRVNDLLYVIADDELQLGIFSATTNEPGTLLRLRDVDGIPLSFSDATALPDGCLLFTAIAEGTSDSYADGPCAGAAIGIVDLNHELTTLQTLSKPLKIEGVESVAPSTTQSPDTIDLLLVTDADDPDIAASLYRARLRRCKY